MPNVLLDAGRLDGTSPIRLKADSRVPVVRPGMMALVALLPTAGGKQYLWPRMTMFGEEGLIDVSR